MMKQFIQMNVSKESYHDWNKCVNSQLDQLLGRLLFDEKWHNSLLGTRREESPREQKSKISLSSQRRGLGFRHYCR